MVELKYTATLAVGVGEGKVQLTPAGHDLIRAILLQGADTALKAEESARRLMMAGDTIGAPGSVVYHRNVRAFLLHMAATLKRKPMDLTKQLQELALLSPGQLVPPSWEPYLKLAKSEGATDGTGATAQPERAGPSRGHAVPPARRANGRGRAVPAEPDAGGSGSD